MPEVKNSGIRAYTRDAGALDVEYSVEKKNSIKMMRKTRNTTETATAKA